MEWDEGGEGEAEDAEGAGDSDGSLSYIFGNSFGVVYYILKSSSF